MENEKVQATLLKTPDGRQANLTEVLASHPAFVIGTDPRANLHLMGVGIEAAHAVIARHDTHYYIVPRVPAAQVSLNGQPVTKPTRFNMGDTLQLGAVSLTVAQSEGMATAAHADSVLLPAVVKGRPLPIERIAAGGAIVTAPAAIKPFAQPREIYFPKPEVSRGMNLSALISSLVTVLIVTLVIGYGLVNSSPATATDLTSQFAYKDGHVTVVMFDADW